MTRHLPAPTSAPQVIDLLPSSDMRVWSASLPDRRAELTGRLLSYRPVGWTVVRAARSAEILGETAYAAVRGIAVLLRAVLSAGKSESVRRLMTVLRRFLRGDLLSGETRTDASTWRRGRRQRHEVEGQSAPWSYKAGIERAAIRWAVLCYLYAAGRLIWPTPTLIVAGGLATIGLTWWLCGVRTLGRRRQHRRERLVPLHQALRDVVHSTAAAPEDWLHVPLDYRADPSRVRIDLPGRFTGDPRLEEHVVTVVRSKLGLDSGTQARFRLAGARPHLTFHRPSQPPSKVGLADVRTLLDGIPDHAPLIGLAAERHPVVLDLRSESPHFLASAGTGGGKSVLLRSLLAQGLYAGSTGVVLDVKQFSHMWATGLPHCRYCVTAEEIHDELLRLFAECQRRTAHARAHANTDGDTDHIDVGPRIYVLCEEMNATTGMLQAHWRKIKQKGDPLTSPAVAALQFLSFMGRAVKMHLLLVAQRGSAQAVGGADMRENFDTRALTRYSMATWKILAPQIWPAPPKSLHPGRWQIVRGDHATETQVLYLSPAEARELALAGYARHQARGMSQPAPPRQESLAYRDDLREQAATPTTVAVDVAPASSSPSTPSDRAPATHAPHGPEPVAAAAGHDSAGGQARPIGLRQAVQERIVTGMSLTALRKCRERDPDFPEVIAMKGPEKLHDAAELARWFHSRTTR